VAAADAGKRSNLLEGSKPPLDRKFHKIFYATQTRPDTRRTSAASSPGSPPWPLQTPGDLKIGKIYLSPRHLRAARMRLPMRTWTISSSWPASARTAPLRRNEEISEREKSRPRTQIRTSGPRRANDPTKPNRRLLILPSGGRCKQNSTHRVVSRVHVARWAAHPKEHLIVDGPGRCVNRLPSPRLSCSAIMLTSPFGEVPSGVGLWWC
jgi:hypothetical protein